jgi:cell division septation protein DedD
MAAPTTPDANVTQSAHPTQPTPAATAPDATSHPADAAQDTGAPHAAPAAPPAPQPAQTPAPLPATPLGPGDFHVQAGAFRNAAYADDLARQLRADGYHVTIVKQELIRVWVGPAMSRAAAERLAANLRANGFEALLAPVQ